MDLSHPTRPAPSHTADAAADTGPDAAPNTSPVPAALPLTLTAADGTRLAATHHPAAGTGEGWIVVGSATAVPRGFYRRFAEAAQARGLHVLTLDYRGIGGSAPRSLRGYAPRYADWGRLDLAAAVRHAADRGPTALVGHSFGMHALGMLPEPHRLLAAHLSAGGAGWHGHMPRAEQWRVQLLWRLLGPASAAVLGYVPMKALGIGENLPLSVFRQWRAWCRFPRYFFDDPDSRDLAARFAEVRVPIRAVNATDDLWAPPRSRDAFLEGFTRAPIEREDVAPAALGMPVGHMGYFRPGPGGWLWPRTFRWLAAKGLPMRR
jgi:predicted alpha/beta hydrolase